MHYTQAFFILEGRSRRIPLEYLHPFLGAIGVIALMSASLIHCISRSGRRLAWGKRN